MFSYLTPSYRLGFYHSPQIGEHVVVEDEGLANLSEQPRPLGVVKLQQVNFAQGLQLIDALIIVVLGNDLTPKHLIHHLPGPTRHPKIMF